MAQLRIECTPAAREDASRAIRSSRISKLQLATILKDFRRYPFVKKYQTDRMTSQKYGVRWVSFFIKDIRVLWDFSKDKKSIVIFAIVVP